MFISDRVNRRAIIAIEYDTTGARQVSKISYMTANQLNWWAGESSQFLRRLSTTPDSCCFESNIKQLIVAWKRRIPPHKYRADLMIFRGRSQARRSYVCILDSVAVLWDCRTIPGSTKNKNRHRDSNSRHQTHRSGGSCYFTAAKLCESIYGALRFPLAVTCHTCLSIPSIREETSILFFIWVRRKTVLVAQQFVSPDDQIFLNQIEVSSVNVQ